MNKPVGAFFTALMLVIAISLFISDIQTMATSIAGDAKVTGVTAWTAVLNLVPFFVMAGVAALALVIIFRSVKR